MSHRSVRSVSPYFLLLVILVMVAVSFAGASPLQAQFFCPGVCLGLYGETSGIWVGDTFTVDAWIDAVFIRGWSFGICHDPALVTPVSAVTGSAIENLQTGGFLDYLQVDFSDAGVAMTGVLCAAPCSPPAYPIQPGLLTIQYEALQPGIAIIEMCDTVQFPPDPPVQNVVIDYAGAPYPLNSWPHDVPIQGPRPLLPPNPDYLLGFAPVADGVPGSIRTVVSTLETAPGSIPLQGWSLGICHDPSLVVPVGGAPGAGLATMRLGLPVDFFAVQWDADEGLHSGVVVCHTACATAPVGAEFEILESEYELIGAPGEIATLEYCNDVWIAAFPTETLLVTLGAISTGATLESAAIGIAGGGIPLTEPGFVRGDANGSGDADIADVVSIAMHLFQGAAAPACSDAADADDNGLLDIADVITLASTLFAVGEPLEPPYPACGADRTGDVLPCASMCP